MSITVGDVEGLHANDVPVRVNVHRHTVLDVEVVVRVDLPKLSIQSIIEIILVSHIS